MTVLTTGQIQKHGQSPLAMLQQNKRDDTRLFFNQRNHPIYFALTRKQPNTKQPTAELFLFAQQQIQSTRKHDYPLHY